MNLKEYYKNKCQINYIILYIYIYSHNLLHITIGVNDASQI